MLQPHAIKPQESVGSLKTGKVRGQGKTLNYVTCRKTHALLHFVRAIQGVWAELLIPVKVKSYLRRKERGLCAIKERSRLGRRWTERLARRVTSARAGTSKRARLAMGFTLR